VQIDLTCSALATNAPTGNPFPGWRNSNHALSEATEYVVLRVPAAIPTIRKRKIMSARFPNKQRFSGKKVVQVIGQKLPPSVIPTSPVSYLES